jgi:hypothetical protein
LQRYTEEVTLNELYPGHYKPKKHQPAALNYNSAQLINAARQPNSTITGASQYSYA